jgi:hypothetical protein
MATRHSLGYKAAIIDAEVNANPVPPLIIIDDNNAFIWGIYTTNNTGIK